MSTRTVRLDHTTEQALEHVMQMTGLSVTKIMKQGIIALEHQLEQQEQVDPYAIFESLGEIPSNPNILPARQAKQAATIAIKRKHKR